MSRGTAEPKPAWYRARNYKGDLTEAEKRQLDAFRAQATHPSASESDLPEEVQRYIGSLEMEVYDQKQDALAGRTILASAFGGLIIIGGVTETIAASVWAYAFGGLMLVLPWPIYRFEWKRNAEAFLPSEPHAPNPTDEAIRKEWELEYIMQQRDAKRAMGRKTA